MAFAINQTDWDFRKCPKSELRACLFYELAREIPEWRKKVEKFRSDSHKWSRIYPTFPLFGILGGTALSADDIFQLNLSFITGIKEWPDKPWLALPDQQRKELVKSEGNGGCEFADGLLGHVEALQAEGQHYRPYRTFDHGSHKLTYAVVKIDWRHNDTDLTERFKKLLKLLGRPHKPTEKRGQKLEPQDVLKNLGALRLLRLMNWQRASILTAKAPHSGQPLYSNQPNWNRAKASALRAIAVLKETQSIDKVLERKRFLK